MIKSIKTQPRKLLKILQTPFVIGAARRKWYRDRKHSPLSKAHWPLYREIHRMYFFRNREFPNIIDGESYNNKITWLKLFGQNARTTELSDKLKVKDFVTERLGPGYTPKTLGVYAPREKIDLSKLPSKFVLKTNHDSDGVEIIDQELMTQAGLEKRIRRLKRRIARPYGYKGGEWQYLFIERRLFAEEFVNFGDGGVPADYKFHCSDGHVLWLEYIYDRDTNSKQIITTANGEPTEFVLGMPPGGDFVKPRNWTQIVDIAGKLSADFPYVRVDLYNDGKSVFVGELTFTPDNGIISTVPQIDKHGRDTNGNVPLGKLIKIDRTKTSEPIFSLNRRF